MLKTFNRIMGPIYVRLPTPKDFLNLTEEFFQISDIFGTILAVDGTHIPIEAPKNMNFNYINRKGWYSISFQVVVDANYIIRDIFGGIPEAAMMHISIICHHLKIM